MNESMMIDQQYLFLTRAPNAGAAATTTAAGGGSTTRRDPATVLHRLLSILDLIIAFASLVESIYAALPDRSPERRIGGRSPGGGVGSSSSTLLPAELPAELETLGTQYREGVKSFYATLREKERREKSDYVRALCCRLDFNRVLSAE
eukprot:GHVU01013308.1.p4 GENE.GHVU01013308.1~~GHVU01013308.1.p4  ORF type:complete len:148 (+),score=31.59 GHVU01013308.1:488-931(+)